MPTFNYHTGPNPQGGFRTYTDLGDQVSDETLLGQIASLSGTTPEVARSVCLALFASIRSCAAGCSWSDGFLDELSFRPTSGGSRPLPEDFQSAVEMNADIAMTFTPSRRDAWRASLSLHKTGSRGLVTPVVASVVSMENGMKDHYVAGTMLRLSGQHLRFNRQLMDEGVFFSTGDFPEVRVAVYGTVDPGEVQLLVPEGLTGSLRLRIAARINGSLRSYTYGTLFV